MKDLRRIALPAGALVGFVLVTTIWFCRTHLAAEAVAANVMLRWIESLGGAALASVGMQAVISVLVAAHLVFEDPVVGTTTFWQTRPIGRGRLLAAKVIAGVLALVVVPTLVLMPVWLASGFSLGELVPAAIGMVAWRIVFVLVAFLFASLSRSIAQFFFSTLAVAVVFALAVIPPRTFGWGTELGANVELTRKVLVVVLSLAIAAFVTVHQFLTRRTRLGWSMIVAGIVAIHLVRVYWPRDLTPYFQSESWPAASGDDLRGTVEVEKISLPADRSRPPVVTVRAEHHGDGSFFAPQSGDVQLRWLDGSVVALAVKPGNQWGLDAAQRLAGVKLGEGPIAWEMVGGADAASFPSYRPRPEITGKIALTRVSAVVLLEVPLRAGAEARHGSSGFRVVAVIEGAGPEHPTVVVEERDAWFRREADSTGWGTRAPDDSRLESYFLVNRATGMVQALRTNQRGSAELSKLCVRMRQLEFSYPERTTNWREGTTLIKVRFEEERRLTRRFAAERVTLISEEATK